MSKRPTVTENTKITVWQFERGNQGNCVKLGYIRVAMYEGFTYYPHSDGLCCSPRLVYEVIKWIYIDGVAYEIRRQADDPFAKNANRRKKNCVVLDSDTSVLYKIR